MAKSDLLNFLKDINYVYNDCGMHDSVSKMLDDFKAEIRAKAIDEFAEKLKENIYPMSHGLGVHDIDRITESMKNSCISKTFREIDTDYIAEQLKEE